MAKKIIGFIKLQVPAGKANPAPPIGPALGQRGLNIMEFCKPFSRSCGWSDCMYFCFPVTGGDLLYEDVPESSGSSDSGRDHRLLG